MRRTINLRFLAFLLAGLALFSIGAYFVHAYQVKHNATALLDQARQARAQGDLPRAARYFSRYLAFVPEDTDALADYGFTLEKLAHNSRAHVRAFLTLEEVLRRDPDRRDVRRSQAKLAMQIGRFTDAIAHFDMLLKDAAADGELLDQLAQAEEGGGHFADAALHYDKALKAGYRNRETYVRLAGLLRRQPSATAKLVPATDQAKKGARTATPPTERALADRYMAEMVAKHHTSFKAHLALAAYHKEFGPQDQVVGDVARAQALAPTDAEVLLALAEAAGANEAGRKQARKYLHQGIDLHRKDARFYVALAQLELRAGDPAEARRRLREAEQFTPRTTNALWVLADMLLDAEDLPEARKIFDGLHKEDPRSPLVRYLEGRVLFREGAWHRASRVFGEILPQLEKDKDLSKRANLFLGQCYERLGNPDLALAAYRQAISTDALWVPARLGLASAALSLNKTEAALEEYRALQGTVPESGLAIARLLILRNLGLAASARDWDQVEVVLTGVEKALPDSLDVRILRAEVLVAQKKSTEAKKLLEAASEKQRKQAAYWVARAGLAERMGQLDQSLALLDEGERRLGRDIELDLGRARYWAKRDKAPATRALAALEKSVGKYPAADQARLRLGLAQAHYRLENTAQAERLWTQVAEDEGLGNSLYVRILLFDLALRAGNDAKMQQQIGQIHDIEGQEGALWRYAEAARLVRLAEKGDKAGLPRAKQRLVEVGKRRPFWSRVSLLQATIQEVEGDSEEAIKDYQEAVRQGDRQPQVIRRLVQLLYERRRFVEADEVLRSLPEQTPISGDLVRLAAEISLRNQDPERALELAQLAATSKSRDYRDLVWFGQILAALQRNDEAAEKFRAAVTLAGKEPDAWVAFVYFLSRTGQKEKAAAVVAEAQAKLPPAERPLALAQCYEGLGQPEKATTQYEAALKVSPDDGHVLRGAVHFYLRAGLPRQAEPYLVRLLGDKVKVSAEDRSWARRNLAFVYATQGKVERLSQALALLDENRRLKGDTPEDQRTRAVVLALHPGRQQEAIRTLEELGRRHPLTPDEQLVLASLYETTGDWREARSRLLSLVTSNSDNPRYLAHYIHSLLLRGQADKAPHWTEEAQHWLAKLEKIDANSARTLELKTKVLQKQGRVTEAIAAVKAYAQGKDSQPDVAAALLDKLGQPAATEAEMAYRGLLKSGRQEVVFAFAGFLGRQGKVKEALDVWENTLQKATPEVAARTGMGVLRAAKADAGQARRVERWLKVALTKEPTPALLLVLADLQDYQGDHAAAAATYRQILQKDAESVLALNNLAWLLTLKLDRHDEALQLVTRAINKVGPLPQLLDTRAVIWLDMRQAPQALKDLEQVVAQEPSAGRYFHLARARWMDQDRAGAAAALRNAQAMGLTPESLHPLEQTSYRELLASVTEQ
jgi:tetratricopeptide (TPR) repeat protein